MEAPVGTCQLKEDVRDEEGHRLLDSPADTDGHRHVGPLDDFHDESPLAFAGPLLLLFSIYSLRFVVFPWLWHGQGLDIFVPVLSPVYRQAEHWQRAAEENAVLLHVSSGAVMLMLGLVQFDKTIRRSLPWLHRWSGRGYAVSGLLCLYALRKLRGSVGAGSSPSGRSNALVLFIDISSFLWVLATAGAILCAMKKNVRLHRDLMAVSFAAASVPIAQRLFSWFFLAPLTIILRLIICLLSDISPWRAQFGPPGSSYTTLMTFCTTDVPQLDPRACPKALSLDGYGEAEQSSFALSAWLGFAVVLVFGAPRLLSHVRASENSDKPDPNIDLSELSLCDAWRIIPTAMHNVISALSSFLTCTTFTATQNFSANSTSAVALSTSYLLNRSFRPVFFLLIPILGAITVAVVFASLVSLTIFVTALYLGFIFTPIYLAYVAFFTAVRVL